MTWLRARWPDALLLVMVGALAVLAGLAQTQGPVLAEGGARWLAAVGALALYAGGCTWLIRRRRTPRNVSAASLIGLPVIHASQTGHAELLAERSAASLRSAGIASSTLAIDAVTPAQLAAWPRVLLVLSTTGEGDAPDVAAGFLPALESAAPRLVELRYGLLALGDRDYAQFCGYARRVDACLRGAGAQPLFDLIEVDDGDPGALRHWQHQLRELADAPELPDWEAPGYQCWRLRSRRLLNPGSLGGPVYRLDLIPDNAAHLAWEAGDIAEIGPRHADAAVRDWLERHALDGEVSCLRDGETLPLRVWLARSHWPSDLAPGIAAQTLVEALQPLPHREYSIASLPADGSLQLLVRLARRADGSLGIGSGWLCVQAAEGAPIALRVRRNRGFHAPPDARPLLLSIRPTFPIDATRRRTCYGLPVA
ncbi:MAG: flavodoxin domain-containing protein [Xanthomonadales bacterium]|nr:hypothetical protein [Xanthomonadales bacterium]MCC6592778.1 flavodoxin domain-containing protein [Xanthomonadales bacterium]MCE7932516.1 sulfite reductase flavoprotein subunit alpha [Xanthomonadales bacterium PRO6]